MRQDHTLCSKVLGSLQIVHGFQGLGLLFGELLLIIVLSGAGYPVKEDAALLCAAEVIDDGEDEETEACGAKYGKDTDHDTLCS